MRPRNAAEQDALVRVVLFTGGRGSSVLSKELIGNHRVALTLAINGYDDGLSTGEVRRFLGDCLGPSDFRKNASRLAGELRTCDERLVKLFDLRFPDDYTAARAAEAFQLLQSDQARPTDPFQERLAGLVQGLGRPALHPVAQRLAAFEAELARSGKSFSFADCSIGNLVFAGSFLKAGRRFNPGLDDYCALLGLPPAMVDNVTDGSNAWLVAVDAAGRVIPTETEIVNSDRPHAIRDIFLLPEPLSPETLAALGAMTPDAVLAELGRRSVTLRPNPRLLERIAEADLIVYAPGTQHSSLFPSYFTPEVGSTIGRNLRAVKVLITNLQEDAEISGQSAVDLVSRALYYLEEKGRRPLPTPSLITHYLINDPGHDEGGKPYVPLGALEHLEDPRLVRIGNYEDGVSGRHDASRVLTPFVETLLRRGDQPRVAILLLDADSLNKSGQTIVEMVRAGIEQLPVALSVYHEGARFDETFTASLPFDVHPLSSAAPTREAALAAVAGHPGFDYLVLFESSGMYRGEDIVNLCSHLHSGRLDAVWGSRRLSVNDIRQAYRLVYRNDRIRGALSWVGSHLLSLSYLFLYGRYLSDTLSGARAVRASILRDEPVRFDRGDFNQVILSRLLRDHAEVIETPVSYFPISPEKVRRTTMQDGLLALLTILRLRLTARRAPRAATEGSPVTALPPAS